MNHAVQDVEPGAPACIQSSCLSISSVPSKAFFSYVPFLVPVGIQVPSGFNWNYKVKECLVFTTSSALLHFYIKGKIITHMILKILSARNICKGSSPIFHFYALKGLKLLAEIQTGCKREIIRRHKPGKMQMEKKSKAALVYTY